MGSNPIVILYRPCKFGRLTMLMKLRASQTSTSLVIAGITDISRRLHGISENFHKLASAGDGPHLLGLSRNDVTCLVIRCRKWSVVKGLSPKFPKQILRAVHNPCNWAFANTGIFQQSWYRLRGGVGPCLERYPAPTGLQHRSHCQYPWATY